MDALERSRSPAPDAGGEGKCDPTETEAKHVTSEGQDVMEGGKSGAGLGVCAHDSSLGLPHGADEVACTIGTEGGEDTSSGRSKDIGPVEGSSTEGKCKAFGAQHHAVVSSEVVGTPSDVARPPVDVECVWSLLALASSSYRKFRSTGAPDDISEAIEAVKKAVEITPLDNESLPHMLGNLGSYLQMRFRRTGVLADMAESISVLEKAVDITSTSTPYNLLNNLANAYQAQYQCTSDLSSLKMSTTIQKRAVNLLPDDHPHLLTLLSNLGRTVHSLSQHTGDQSDLSEAISIHSRVVRLTPEGHPQLPSRLNDLGVTFHSRFRYAGSLSDLTQAISLQRKSVDLSPETHESLPVYLSALAYSLHSLFERTGSLSDITEAILLQGKAVSLTPEVDTTMPTQLNHFAGFLQARFERTGTLSDLQEAITLVRKSLRLCHKGDTGRPGLLNNLGNYLLHLSVRMSDPPSLVEAISLQRQALELTPDGHPDRPSRLNNLGGSLRHQFERTGVLPDLTEAISIQNQAVDSTSGGHPDLPMWLTNLGNSYSRLFEKTADLEALKAGLEAQKRALESVPKGHAILPYPLYEFAQLSYKYFRFKDLPKHLDAAIENFAAAATSVSGSPQPKITAAKRWARTLNQHHPQSVEVITAFETMIGLLALVAGLEHTVQHRFAMLEEHPGLILEAAATMFRLELVEKALEWLEQGRCLVWGQQHQLRTPLDELWIHDPSLADKVMDVSRQLEHAGSSSRASKVGVPISERISLEEEAGNHVRLATEWEHLLATVRATPGFERFLQPPTLSALVQHLPVSGPVVIINIHDSRCDAIAILAGSDEPVHIPLPHFSSDKARKYRRDLRTRLSSRKLRMQGEDEAIMSGVTEIEDDADPQELEMGNDGPDRAGGLYSRRWDGVRGVLRGLWVQVVKPILQALAISKADASSSDMLPRIWWCPTGPLSFLPLHAAGEYNYPDPESVLDYVVSSYTPTISSLGHRIKNDTPIDPAMAGLLLTCQPRAPGAAEIPGNVEEVSSIYTQAVENGCKAMKLEGDAVSPEGFLKHLEEFSCIHLACHGSQDAGDPLQSRFIFHRGRLSLGDISQRNLSNADLAFLSACETSTGQETLSDEAVHLAAGMLAAGYRRVVATMWAIGDTHAPQVASDFYKYLRDHREEGSGTPISGRLSAYALHHAIQQLRESIGSSDGSLLAWVPYVHYGY
ncbi:hypothetical protein FA13DRAFT_1741760 [Coprinellus micaceus]|uniref:CHAT domain-containing protein n=1 Tax=Coprinellus micaceus TaxID=71717 RepID=A0A4Y7SI12_COPMI|nr:hypothetical protein FA13DRAFT_1741760 [Coprinellus micaceus]